MDLFSGPGVRSVTVATMARHHNLSEFERGSVTVATMARHHNLSEFERGVTVCARKMRHSISEVAMRWGFSRTTILRGHREYRKSGKKNIKSPT